MKLVVGLGNPGPRYENTRHNVGFEVLEILAQRHGASGSKQAYQGEAAEIRLGSDKVLLLQPHTYMNLSGRSVQQAVSFFKLELEDLLVVCDDLNLPCGKLRVRPGGSSGGQNGLNSIIQMLGSQDFPRLRIGIDRPPGQQDPAAYVLGRFLKAQQEEIDISLQLAADAVEVWVAEGLEACMNKFN